MSDRSGHCFTWLWVYKDVYDNLIICSISVAFERKMVSLIKYKLFI